MSFCVENLTDYPTAMSRITRARVATVATEVDPGDASEDQLRLPASASRSNPDQRAAAMTTDNKLFPSKCSWARAATAATAATEEDPGDASGDQLRLPASVSRSNLDQRVAAMTAAGTSDPGCSASIPLDFQVAEADQFAYTSLLAITRAPCGFFFFTRLPFLVSPGSNP